MSEELLSRRQRELLKRMRERERSMVERPVGYDGCWLRSLEGDTLLEVSFRRTVLPLVQCGLLTEHLGAPHFYTLTERES